MTAPSEDADLARRIAELEQTLRSSSAENARLQHELTRSRERQTTGAEILATIAGTSGDADNALQRIAETTAKLFGASSVSIQLAENGEWGKAYRYGTSAQRIRAAVPLADIKVGGRNMPGAVVGRNRQIHVPDLDRLDGDLAEFPGLPHARAAGSRTMCGTPLRSQGKAIGALIIHRDRLEPFSEEELALQQSFADQAAIAIENARLFNETREALERQTATADILKVIASSPSDVQPVFDAIATSANKLIGGLSTTVFSLVDDTMHLSAFTPTSPAADAALKASFPRPLPTRPWAEDLRNGRTFQVLDTEIEYAGQPDLRDMARLRGFRGLVIVPLLRDQTLIGTINVTRAEPGRFADDHIRLLETFANQAVIAIENTRLFNETKEALERQTATADVLRVIASSPSSLGPVFDTIARRANQLIGGHSTTVFRFNGDTGELAAFTPISEEADAQLRAAFPRPVSTMLGIEQISRGEIAETIDTESDAEPEMSKTIARARGFRSRLLVPLKSDDRVIGMISITRKEPGSFAKHHVELLKTFADQAAIAIQNTRLFNETREALERQTATADILKVIASSPSDVQPVFDAIATSSKRLIGGFSTAVFRFVDGIAHLAAFTPTSPEADEVLKAGFPSAVDRFEPFKLAQGGKPVQIPDIEGLPDSGIKEIARARGFRSMLFAPLMSSGQPIGLISVTRLDAGSFVDHHVQLLQTFADQAVIAIENARLFEQVQARTRDLTEALQQQTATADVLKVISRSAFDLQAVLDTLVTSASTLCNADQSMLLLFEGGVLKPLSYFGPHPDKFEFRKSLASAPHRGIVSGRAVLDGRTAHVPDVLSDPEFTNSAWQELTGFRAMLAVPLMREGKPIGAMALSRQVPGPFAGRQIELVQTFADQAVIAIENSRLFDEVQAKTRDLTEALQQQTATADVLKVISRSAFDLQTVFDALLTSACRLCEADIGTIRYEDGGSYRLAATYGCKPEWIDHFQTYTSSADRSSIFGRTILDGRAIHVPDVLADPDYRRPAAQKLMGFRAALGVPLVREGHTFGVINLFRFAAGSFEDKQIELVATFADQAVIAIENVRLFEQVQARTRELSEALTYQTGSANILKVIASSPTDVGPVLRTIVDSACELCEAYDAVLVLREGRDLVVRAHHGPIEMGAQTWPDDRSSVSGRAIADRAPIHLHDVLSGEGADFPVGQAMSRRDGCRTILAVPMLSEGESIGAIVLRRAEMQPFSDKQVNLLQTFADQAVIALGNVRLFEEVQARTKELAKSLDDLRAAQDRLVQTEKLASLGQLTAGIAHEIKNPLNFVNNFSSLSVELIDELNELLGPAALADGTREAVDELTEMLKGNLDKVVQHGKRADSIVKNMLLHSREGSGERRPADVNALVEESLNLAYHGARAEKSGFNVTLTRELDPDIGTAELYPQEITRVLLNLISNGFYAVTKRMETAGAGFEPTLSAVTRARDGEIEIRIRDNGSGIPQDVLSRIFNPFFTTKPAGEGTGLGLSMSHDIVVKQHGGRIDVATEPGMFTEFIITLPRTGAAPTQGDGT